MFYSLHINRPNKRVTIHDNNCRHWQKHLGTAFHKLGLFNSYYFPSNPQTRLDFDAASIAASVWRKELRYEIKECAHCCKGHK